MATTAIPAQAEDERPTRYADRVGASIAAHKSALYRKKTGLYLTPVEVADFMAASFDCGNFPLRILDPAAGSGTLLCAIVEALARRGADRRPRSIELVAYEIDHELVEALGTVTTYLRRWAARRELPIVAQINHQDFISAHAEWLHPSRGLFQTRSSAPFDLVVANPPYFKILKADPREQRATSVMHGSPNIYAQFMAIGAALLREGGAVLFITPRSFASGSYFRLFRERFFSTIRPVHIHVFGSRREAFGRDEVLQENIILKGVRASGWCKGPYNGTLLISSSSGLADLNRPLRRPLPLTSALDLTSAEKVLRLPILEGEHEAVRVVDSWPGSLHRYGLNISTGPVVPFRAAEFLARTGDPTKTHAPLLWMHHVRPMRIRWPNGAPKPQFIKRSVGERPLLVPNRNYVLLRRFSAKEEARRLVAAPWFREAAPSPSLGIENHLNYIHRPGSELSVDEAWGLAALFNSTLLDTYFRVSSGNTQVSATELRAMPLPPREALISIGRNAERLDDCCARLDNLVDEALNALR